MWWWGSHPIDEATVANATLLRFGRYDERPDHGRRGGFERLFCPRLQRYTDLELDEPAGAPLNGDCDEGILEA
jgi:hypothetical protein